MALLCCPGSCVLKTGTASGDRNVVRGQVPYPGALVQQRARTELTARSLPTVRPARRLRSSPRPLHRARDLQIATNGFRRGGAAWLNAGSIAPATQPPGSSSLEIDGCRHGLRHGVAVTSNSRPWRLERTTRPVLRIHARMVTLPNTPPLGSVVVRIPGKWKVFVAGVGGIM